MNVESSSRLAIEKNFHDMSFYLASAFLHYTKIIVPNFSPNSDGPASVPILSVCVCVSSEGCAGVHDCTSCLFSSPPLSLSFFFLLQELVNTACSLIIHCLPWFVLDERGGINARLLARLVHVILHLLWARETRTVSSERLSGVNLWSGTSEKLHETKLREKMRRPAWIILTGNNTHS